MKYTKRSFEKGGPVSNADVALYLIQDRKANFSSSKFKNMSLIKKIVFLFSILFCFNLNAQNATSSQDSLFYVNKDIVINKNCSYYRTELVDSYFTEYFEFTISVLNNSKIKEVSFYFNYCEFIKYEKLDKKKETIHNFSFKRTHSLPIVNPTDPTGSKKGLFIKYQKNKKWYYKRISFFRDIVRKN